MDEITIDWQDDAYSVYQNGEFIHDNEDLHEALAFALAVGENLDLRVIVEGIAP